MRRQAQFFFWGGVTVKSIQIFFPQKFARFFYLEFLSFEQGMFQFSASKSKIRTSIFLGIFAGNFLGGGMPIGGFNADIFRLRYFELCWTWFSFFHIRNATFIDSFSQDQCCGVRVPRRVRVQAFYRVFFA
jgi:hypothetical protein